MVGSHLLYVQTKISPNCNIGSFMLLVQITCKLCFLQEEHENNKLKDAKCSIQLREAQNLMIILWRFINKSVSFHIKCIYLSHCYYKNTE